MIHFLSFFSYVYRSYMYTFIYCVTNWLFSPQCCNMNRVFVDLCIMNAPDFTLVHSQRVKEWARGWYYSKRYKCMCRRGIVMSPFETGERAFRNLLGYCGSTCNPYHASRCHAPPLRFTDNKSTVDGIKNVKEKKKFRKTKRVKFIFN